MPEPSQLVSRQLPESVPVSPTGCSGAPALVVSSVCGAEQAVARLGREAYSYYYVYRAFQPLLRRWGVVAEVGQAPSQLDYALQRARSAGQRPIHLSFLPLHQAYLTTEGPNVSFPFWEFPDIPDEDFAGNPRNNWKRVAERLSLILTASRSTQEAFRRAGVRTPIRVVPVPVRPPYFQIPSWDPGQRVVLSCPVQVLPGRTSFPAYDPWRPPAGQGPRLSSLARGWYRECVQPWLPPRVERPVRDLARAALHACGLRRAAEEEADEPALELSGVVYTTILNPFDPRKNWQDLLSAFLRALGEREDALLVIKLAICPELAAAGRAEVLGCYRELGLPHRCRVAVVTDYLSNAQLRELTRGSTYYVTATRAEGACLPLQDFLAAGRPGIAPVHTALTDYFADDVGFAVASHPEPACWPHDPRRCRTTTWHRPIWQSLHDQFRASYDVARRCRGQYQLLANRARQRIESFASRRQVWPRLAAALRLVSGERTTDDKP